MRVSDTSKNRGAHGDSSFKLDGMPSSSENPPALAVGSVKDTCIHLSDEFTAVCVSADCPVCGDFCPCINYPEICKYAELEGRDG